MSIDRLAPPVNQSDSLAEEMPRREALAELLSGNLDFHEESNRHDRHNFHSFPAKFPPQLPRKFIHNLTAPGDVVLDPMMGSGTTVYEALVAGRNGIGFDIDPLAVRITKVKISHLEPESVEDCGWMIIERARKSVEQNSAEIAAELSSWWQKDQVTARFIQDWFDKSTQIELLALRNEIWRIRDVSLRSFFEVVLSAIIITKSGGVSLALDLAHTRPHKAKLVLSRDGKVVYSKSPEDETRTKNSVQTKLGRSVLNEFEKRFQQNLRAVASAATGNMPLGVCFGNAQQMPLLSSSIDLIVTSPPYASNAIDYMRAHKFSLVWLGYPSPLLSVKRREYMGGEVVCDSDLIELPDVAMRIVQEVTNKDPRKGRVLHLYYSQMTRVLQEMYRVLKPGRAAVVVVGSSQMRGVDTETQNCLAAIGQSVGFEVASIGRRNLDRDKRMLPAGSKVDLNSQIQNRMHIEYVIGYYKPDSVSNLP